MKVHDKQNKKNELAKKEAKTSEVFNASVDEEKPINSGIAPLIDSNNLLQSLAPIAQPLVPAPKKQISLEDCCL